MRSAARALAVCLLGASAGAAHAEGYFSLGYGQHEQDRQAFGDEIDTGDVLVKFGGRLTDYFSSELRTATTLSRHEGRLKSGTDAEYSINYLVGGYLKASWPNRTVTTPYLITGYTELEEQIEAGGRRDWKNDLEDASFGIGVDADIGEHFGVNLEYMQYHDKFDVKIDGFSVSAYLHF